jgi:hypothetical protein
VDPDKLMRLMAYMALPLLVLGCGPSRSARPTQAVEMAEPSAAVGRPTTIPSAAQPPDAASATNAWAQALGTLDAQMTAEPCSPEKVVVYSDTVLSLADQHMRDAAIARGLEAVDPATVDSMYDRARARSERLQALVPPSCASTAHIKFVNAFKLLVDVWDHLGEREYDLAQRKLASSYDELANGAELLTTLQSRLAGGS